MGTQPRGGERGMGNQPDVSTEASQDEAGGRPTAQAVLAQVWQPYREPEPRGPGSILS